MRTAEPGGGNLLADDRRHDGMAPIRGHDPRTGAPAAAAFTEASDAAIAEAVAAAADAHQQTRLTSDDARAELLRAIADGLERDGAAIVATADAETALGEVRLRGELARTTGQLRAFATLVEEGSYVDAIIDTDDPAQQPPRPDLRRMQVPIGPVAVLGASNFPLAFGVPGGDTAAALAAGCPVVVKAHPSQPATSERCAQAITGAVLAQGWPAGTFSMLHGASHRVGARLVTADAIAAVAFTGSRRGGRALFDLAAARPRPIPVYAEMGSVNPVFVTARALAQRADVIADDLVTSMTIGTGQFCTKPGLLVLPAAAGSAASTRVLDALRTRLERTPAGCLLNAAGRDGLATQLERSAAHPDVEVVVAGGPADGGGYGFSPALLHVDADTWQRTPALHDEHFGPVAVVVSAGSHDAAVQVAEALEGTLTATVHGVEDDIADEAVAGLLHMLRERAGRLIWNGMPTGVAVTHAMHHGGPYPASTAAGHTSVGTTAIRRFLRPVAYQDMPQVLLPAALRDDNPRSLLRLVDGRPTRGAVDAEVPS